MIIVNFNDDQQNSDLKDVVASLKPLRHIPRQQPQQSHRLPRSHLRLRLPHLDHLIVQV